MPSEGSTAGDQHRSALAVAIFGTVVLIGAYNALLWAAFAGTPIQFGAALLWLAVVVLALWRSVA
jgi:hypothetical protein